MADKLQNELAEAEATQRTNSAIKRYALIAIPVFAAVAVFALVFWPKIQLGLWINGLHSDAPEIRRQMRENIKQAAKDDPAVLDQLAEAVADGDRGFNVRQAVVGLLLELNRDQVVLKTYERGDLGTRAVILARLQREREFSDYWADDPALKVRETVRAWLAREGDFDRGHAIQIAMQLNMSDSIELIRPMLVRSTDSTVHAEKKRNILIAAAAAVERFGDCGSLGVVADLAEKDPDFLVRMRSLQSLQRAVTAEKSPCADEFDKERLTSLVRSALDDETKEVRMAGLLILEKHPEWATGLTARLREILDGNVQEGMRGTERRHALNVLIRLREPAFVSALPKYFFDPNPSVRSSCAAKSLLFHVEGPRLESCLIGLVRNEGESDAVFRAAFEALRHAAGKWYGLPRKVELNARDNKPAFYADLGTLFSSGEIEGATRDTMTKAWFEWLCRDLGVGDDRIASFHAAREGFWKAADNGDAAGARAALMTLKSAPAGVFTYEQTWLALNEE